MNDQPQRIAGFDPGLTLTGYALLEDLRPQPRIVEAGVIRIPSGRTLEQRLAYLHGEIAQLLEEQRPSALAIEDLFSHYERPRTAILMGHARGVLLLAAGQRGIPVASYLPTRVKRTMTGSGKASKEQMQRAVQNQFDLAQPPEPPDVADAIAIALCHLHARRAAA